MADRPEPLVCVGGPASGSMMGSIASRIDVPIRGTLGEPRQGCTTYVRETFRAQEGSIQFWRPYDQSSLVTQTMLLESLVRLRRLEAWMEVRGIRPDPSAEGERG